MLYQILSTCKGGGYMYCRTNPDHPKANTNGYYPLHRVVMENKIDRNLLPGEDVHHKDENKSNNASDNLEVLTKSEHSKIHIKEVEKIKLICPNCQKEFEIKPHEYRLRKKRNKSKEVYCSRNCGSLMTSKLRSGAPNK